LTEDKFIRVSFGLLIIIKFIKTFKTELLFSLKEKMYWTLFYIRNPLSRTMISPFFTSHHEFSNRSQTEESRRHSFVLRLLGNCETVTHLTEAKEIMHLI
jgi:hypothetical protein